MRVPTIAWWPGQIPADTSTDAISGMFDILPTFAALSGGKLPTDRKLDGANLWPHLSGAPGAQPAHQSFFFYSGLTLEAVRHGEWKLQIVQAKPASNAKSDTPFVPRLYNLKTDVGESRSVADENPEVVAQLQDLVVIMKQDLGLDGPAPGSRELGRVNNPQPLIPLNQ